MVTTYCSSAQVAALMQLPEFTGETRPTNTQVDDYIERNEDVIEEETGHSWKAVTVTEEYVDNPTGQCGVGMRYDLHHRNIKTFDNSEGSSGYQKREMIRIALHADRKNIISTKRTQTV